MFLRLLVVPTLVVIIPFIIDKNFKVPSMYPIFDLILQDIIMASVMANFSVKVAILGHVSLGFI